MESRIVFAMYKPYEGKEEQQEIKVDLMAFGVMIDLEFQKWAEEEI